MELSIFIVMSAVCVFAGALYLGERLRLSRMLEGTDLYPETPLPRLLRLAKWISSALPERFRFRPLRPIESYVGRRINAAGFKADGLERGFVALMIFGFVGFTTLLLATEGDPLRALAGGFCAAFLPLLRVMRTARRRKELMERQMPFVLDMLTLSVEAGADLAQAIVKVAKRLDGGPLTLELRAVVLAMRSGMSRREALGGLKADGNPRSLADLATLLVQADRMGSGTAGILRSFSRRLSVEGFARAERAGAYAAQKLLAPLIFCIMPSTFLVIFGPIAVRLLHKGIDGLLM